MSLPILPPSIIFFSCWEIDKLLIIGRELSELKQTYKQRGYNEQKVTDNLEVESFNLCFYEAVDEGYIEGKQVFLVEISIWQPL